jgi:putative DNA primase/helicase
MTEQTLFCPICKAETKEKGKPDDVGTQFYKCKNGHQTTKALTQEQKDFHEAFEIQTEQNGEKYVDPLNPLAAFCDGKGIFKPALVAQWLKQNENYKTERKTGILYFYDEKKWQQDINGESYLKEQVGNLLGEENNEARFKNIRHCLESITLQDITWSKKIACENGLLDVEKRELTDFNPNEMPFYSIPVTYNLNAKCPLFEKFISEVLNPDDVQTLKEWSGFLLLADYREHKIMWLHGQGRNGKGAWTRTMEGILGEDNVSGVGLEEFDSKHRFAMANLYGSLFNPCNEPEIGYKKVLQTNLLKKATGQDTIDGEIKNKQKRIKFRNRAKITVIANRFPKVEDNTIAFRDRRLFITFPHEYIKENKISNIEETWLNDQEERSGILNWMLDGLHHLLTQGYFTESKTQEETEIQFLRASDPYDAFIKEQAIFNKISYISRVKAFEMFKDYCDFIGITLEKNALDNFTRILRQTKGVQDSSKRIDGKKQRVWIGIDFKPIPDNESGTDGTVNTLFNPSENLEKFQNNKEGQTTVLTVPSVPEAEAKKSALGESKKRYCSSECKNFRQAECPSDNYGYRPTDAEIPLRCPGYEQAQAGEDS